MWPRLGGALVCALHQRGRARRDAQCPMQKTMAAKRAAISSFYATGGTGAVVAGAAVWPLINQMNPSADTRAASTMRVDVSGVAEGSQSRFCSSASRSSSAAARPMRSPPRAKPAGRPAGPGGAQRKPGRGRRRRLNRSLPAFDGENTGEWLVMQGVCTHLGCVPLGDGARRFRRLVLPLPRVALRYIGPYPPGSRPENLPVPHAAFVDDTTILLGETE